jgi:pimeloyl-ACP methyl ester carboxylesterase
MPIRSFAEGSLDSRFAVTLLVAALGSLAVDASAQDAPARRGIGAPPAAALPAETTPAKRAPLDAKWVGAWMGSAKLPAPEGSPAPELPLFFVVRGSDSAPSVEVWSLPAGAQGKACIDVAGDGRTLAFTLESQGASARFEGALAEGDATASGAMRFLDMQRREDVGPQATFSVRRVDIVSELPETRVFAATLEVSGQKLPMRLALGEGARGWCGSMDILIQGVRDFPVAVERTEAGFTVTLAAGATATITLSAKEGEKTLAEMTALEGTFKQASFNAPIRFEVQPGVRAGALRRPQEPLPPFPYESREVSVAHPLGHILAGTLTVPSSQVLAVDGRVPGVVLVTGSGPQDRDETLMGHRPFAVLADALTRAGFAVLRYDDRGTAKSTGNFPTATTADFASDADMAVEWLKRQPGVDPARIGLLGHSEGGLIGPLVAAWQNAGDSPADPLAFLVLIAPPAETGGKILTRQTKALTEAVGITADRLGPMIAAHEALMSEAAMRRPPDALRPLAATLVREQLKLADQPDPDEATLRMLVDQTLMQVSNPWMAEFICTDPRNALLWLEVPTLAVWGTKDLQVDAVVSGAIFEEVAKSVGAPITVRTIDGLNHLLQPAAKGTVEEYGEIDLTIDPAALAGIVAWMTETARKPAPPQVNESTRPSVVRDAYLPPRIFASREPAPGQPAVAEPAPEKPVIEKPAAEKSSP